MKSSASLATVVRLLRTGGHVGDKGLHHPSLHRFTECEVCDEVGSSELTPFALKRIAHWHHAEVCGFCDNCQKIGMMDIVPSNEEVIGEMLKDLWEHSESCGVSWPTTITQSS